MNTRIKRKDVLAAVKKSRTFRKRAEAGIMKPSSKQGPNFLTRLPGEIRNQIYALALDAESNPSPQTLVPRPRNDNKSQTHAGMNLLLLSKEITMEARSILEARATAYIPIMSSMNYCGLTDYILKNGNATLSPTQSTVYAALTSFMNAQFHLHVNYYLDPANQYDNEPHLDLCNAHILGVLRQALIIWKCASEINFKHLESTGVKRKAIVHMDHLFSDWRYMVRLSRPYDEKHIIRLMGEDTTTRWELRYFEHWGNTTPQANANEKKLEAQCELWQEECGKYPYIKFVVEVYGETVEYLEEKDGIPGVIEIDHGVTASSTLWPSLPDDVPWRSFERIRSDVAVEGAKEIL